MARQVLITHTVVLAVRSPNPLPRTATRLSESAAVETSLRRFVIGLAKAWIHCKQT